MEMRFEVWNAKFKIITGDTVLATQLFGEGLKQNVENLKDFSSGLSTFWKGIVTLNPDEVKRGWDGVVDVWKNGIGRIDAAMEDKLRDWE